MRRFILVLSILSVVSPLFSQKDEEKIYHSKGSLPYFLRVDSTSRAMPFAFKFQYDYEIPNGFFRTGGAHFDFSLNLARIFTTKMILGIGADFQPFRFKGQQNLSNTLINDFNSYFQPAYNELYDSLRADILYGSINGFEGYKISDAGFGHFTLVFSPFPDRFGGFLLELKYGRTQYKFSGPGSDSYSNEGRPDLVLTTKGNYGVELAFNPYKIFRARRKKLVEARLKEFYQFLVISLEYEHISLVNSEYAGQKIGEFVHPQFPQNYSSEHTFGIKLGIGIW